MACEAAVKAKVDPILIALYEAAVVQLDSSWYVEHAGLGRRAQAEAEDRAATAALPHLESTLRPRTWSHTSKLQSFQIVPGTSLSVCLIQRRRSRGVDTMLIFVV